VNDRVKTDVKLLNVTESGRIFQQESSTHINVNRTQKSMQVLSQLLQKFDRRALNKTLRSSLDKVELHLIQFRNSKLQKTYRTIAPQLNSKAGTQIAAAQELTKTLEKLHVTSIKREYGQLSNLR
jgi:hypothetical protein